MAEFLINTLEGMQYVEAHLKDEAIRVEAGALSYLTGDIGISSKLIPSVGGILRALLAEERIYRPTYSGTGVVTMESTLGGFHLLDLQNESWILERGTYWASEIGVAVSFHRERLITSIFSGEGLFYLQTKVSGSGKVIVSTRGPTEVIQLQEGMRVVVEGNSVICRTSDVSFSVRRPTRSLLGRITSGEGSVRVYEGIGKIILNTAPYWRYKMLTDQTGGRALSRRASIS